MKRRIHTDLELTGRLLRWRWSALLRAVSFRAVYELLLEVSTGLFYATVVLATIDYQGYRWLYVPVAVGYLALKTWFAHRLRIISRDTYK